MTKSQGIFIAFGILFFLFIGCAVYFNGNYNLNKIKSKTVGDGQYGTARFATDKEVHQSLKYIEFDSVNWRKGIDLPKSQGLVVGSKINFGKTFGYVDCDDIHLLMIGAAGVGKTAHFLYPNLEYACASGVSFITTDTKGDLYRNYGGIAHDYYGYNISVIDLRNPLFSDGNNMLHMVNKYMDQYKQNRNDLSLKAKTEKYAKIIAKTIIFSDGESASSYGQNSFFYDSAEGLLTSIILIISEFCDDGERHIVSVFKLVQDLLKPSGIKGKTQFQILLDYLPDNHKAKWFAGAALNTGEQAMMSVLSTVLSRLNAFIDSEIENSKMTPINKNVVINKYNDVCDKVAKNDFISKDTDIKIILEKSSIVFNELDEEINIPVGQCHGDLTFSNILFNGNNYYLIDFLDSFLESPLLDLVKIRQDSNYGWSQLMYGHDFDSVRMRIISDKIDKEIDIYYSNYDWYNKYYSTFQLMNFLRVIQYAKEERTVAFLKNVLNSIL